jgi:hypothetical protein
MITRYWTQFLLVSKRSLRSIPGILHGGVSRTYAFALTIGTALKVAITGAIDSLAILIRRLFAFAYSVILFQIYFFLTFLVLGHSTNRIWGPNGTMSRGFNDVIDDTGDNIWSDHYYWYFFSCLASCIVGGVLFGIQKNKITKIKTLITFIPNSLFFIVPVILLVHSLDGNLSDVLVNKGFPFAIANITLLILCNALLYHVARISKTFLYSEVKFTNFHFLWLSVPYTVYLAGFIHALSIHAIFTWIDIKIAFYDRFDLSIKHLLRDLINRLTIIGQIFIDIIQIVVDLIIGLALKIWKYPLEYTIKYLNGEFLQNEKKVKSSIIISSILIIGLPCAAITEILCYYLLLLIDKIF